MRVESVLEVGVGVGAMGARLARGRSYTGVEPDEVSCALAASRIAREGGTVICGDVTALGADSRFDLVCAFEVLEHLDDDEAALATWTAFVKPGGVVMVSVPAGSSLFGASDRRVGHVRRYERSALVALLERAGLAEVQAAYYGFPLGYALLAVWNVAARKGRTGSSREERTSTSGRWFQPGDAAGMANRLVTWPFRIAQRPFGSVLGTGLVAVGRSAG
jgi:SAM-dependent methyltransferase